MAKIANKTVGLYVIEDNEIYREAYQSIFNSDGPIRLLGLSANQALEDERDALSTLAPDVLLWGLETLNRDIYATMERFSRDFPSIGIVLIFSTYNADDMKILRKLARRAQTGMALFLRQSLQRTDQFHQVILSTAQGHVILDPALTSLLFTEKQRGSVLEQLTARELEVLDLLAAGYTNQAIADACYIDIKTVRNHINNVYSKFKAESDLSSRHPRVSATRLYLETTGKLLSTDSP